MISTGARFTCVVASVVCGLACSPAHPPPVAAPPSVATTPAATPAAQPPAAPTAPSGIFRLPAGVRPTRQRVELEVVPERDSFSGRVEIALLLDEPRDDLYVSARELTFERGTLTAGGKTMDLSFQPDDERGVARLVLPQRAAAGEATLAISFHAKFNPRLVGLYRVQSRDHWYAYTQFEAVDARRAFPCFDEPAFKIPWEVVLTVPAGEVGVANTPVREEKAQGELKRIAFKASRPLPSYLVAVAVGDFDVVTPPPLPPNEVRKRPLQVRGIAPKGRGAELTWGLQAGGELLVMLERWFGTEFPYEKLDHIAVPDFEYGAMENAGLITYRESALLVDPKRASEGQKLGVAVDLAHEMAHQWFGDLVTMRWWDDLWLNESFATFMETYATNAWAKGSRYDLLQLQQVQDAMGNDESAAVRAIRPDVKIESDIFGFDYAIAYPKGSWVIAMFEQFLGRETFRAGIQRYLAAHADGNATMDDLLGALGATGVDVRPAMRSFVLQPGIPLVQASLRCDGGAPRVALSQSRQLPTGSTAKKDVVWQIPVCVKSDGGGHDCMLLATAEAELPLKSKTCPAWIALNPEAQGYYRWALPSDQLRALLKKGMPKLTPAERLSLGSNLAAGFRSGSIKAEDVLAALGPLARDPEPAVAQEPADLVVFIRDKVVEPAQRPLVQAYLQTLYRPALARVGWKGKAGEPARMQSFRPWVIGLLALTAEDKAVLARAAAMGRAYIGGDGKLHPEAVDRNLVSVAVQAAGKLGDAKLFDTILERLAKEEDTNVRGDLLSALGSFTDPALADRARDLSLDEQLKVNERGIVLSVQGGNPVLRDSTWAWITKNFDAYAPRIPASYVQFTAYARQGCSDEAAEELKSFMGPRAPAYPGAEYTLAKVVDGTRICAAKVAAQRASATKFFTKAS